MKLIQVEKSDTLIDYLKQDEIINLNIIGKIENGSEYPIFTDDPNNPSGVLVKSGYMHFLYTESEAFIDAVLRDHMAEGFYGFAGVDVKIAERIKARKTEHWRNKCSIYTFKEESIDLVERDYDVRSLRIEDAETVDKFYEYRNDNSIHAIRKDIEFRPSSAVYVDDEPVCWVLVHEDNSMGIMYTREEYRRKGLAEVVSRDLTQKILKRGQVPYLQIVDGNEKSHGLAKKCGYVKYGDCEWFGIISGHPKEMKDGAKEVLKDFEKTYGHPRFQGQPPLCVEYFLDINRQEPHPDYEVVILKEDDDWTKWRQGSHKACGVIRPLCPMEAWEIRFKGHAVGGALMEKNKDVEDYNMLALFVDEDFKAQSVFKCISQAMMEMVRKENRYFLMTVVEDSERDLYESAGFLYGGVINV